MSEHNWQSCFSVKLPLSETFRLFSVRLSAFLLTLLLSLSLSSESQARQHDLMAENSHPSAKKALGLSILLPGLGHKHVNDGQWSRSSISYAAADVGLWIALFGGEWHRNQLIDSYTTLARGSAGAITEGKDRTFFLNLAAYQSSDEFLNTVLRNRAWDQIDYVSDPAFQWDWETEQDYNRYRDLRDESESLRRRRSILIASLVANRLLSGAISARKAGREGRVSISARFAAPIQNNPVLALRVGF